MVVSKRAVKNILISASLANLCFLPVWKILNSPSANPYYLADGDSIRIWLAAVLCVSLIALGYWIAFTIVGGLRRASIKTWAERLFLLSLIVPLNGIRDNLSGLNLPHLMHDFSRYTLICAALAFSMCACVVLVKWPRITSRVALAAALIMSPFCLITFARVLWNVRETVNLERRGTIIEANVRTHNSAVRIVWCIFDEMDQRLTFDERPSGVIIRNLDKLKNESIYATNAVSACRDTTEAMPSLTTGHIVAQTVARGPGELMLRYADRQEFVPWSAETTVFSTAQDLGYGTCIVGWYHPYCRVLGRSLTSCLWLPWAFAGRNHNTLSFMLYEWQSMIPVTAQWLRYREHLWRYLQIQEEAEKVVVDRKLNLILIHWPIPHMPYIYDGQAGRFSWVVPLNGYFGNIVLADRSLGAIRRKMEEAGLWDGSVIIVTADHFWRNSKLYDSREDGRVPFIIKIPGKMQSARFDRKFNTVVTRELLEGFLRKEFKTTAQVTGWLDAKSRVR